MGRISRRPRHHVGSITIGKKVVRLDARKPDLFKLKRQANEQQRAGAKDWLLKNGFGFLERL